MAQTLSKGLARWLLRSWLRLGRHGTQAGFVLPTTILLLLVVTLTVGAIGYRTFTRSQQVIGERQQRVIYNAATPAIDRAKAKLEFLFDSDREPRGGGVPRDLQLMSMMLNDGRDLGDGYRLEPFRPGGEDPYTLPGEARLDINGDGQKDNAWRYAADLDGDGVATGPNDGRVFYSVIFTAPDEVTLRSANVAARAAARPFPFVRNSPLSNATQTSATCSARNGADSSTVRAQVINGEGWFPDEVATTKLRKNFQVDAFVQPNNPNGAVATLEFQQDREATRGFKWAAWFRNDLEIFPGPAFNWNGAMHTEGNLIVSGENSDGNSFRSYMISAPASCLYDELSSEITVTDVQAAPEKNIPKFQGQFITGTIKRNNFNGRPGFDIFTSAGQPPQQNVEMTADRDSLNPRSGRRPADYSLDPVRLQTDLVSIGRTVPDPQTDRAGNWEDSPVKRRLVNAQEDVPYVDDTFRADNRWGPYPRWGRNFEEIPEGAFGRPITGTAAQQLTGNDPAPGQESSNVGLDGYWERRARREGLRLIVGQRLELGDPAGWGGPKLQSSLPVDELERREPLKPWGSCPGSNSTRCNEARQRRALWDNLAAVQATAVYHARSPEGVDFPAACIATTVHPGTPGTLDRSATFEDLFPNAPGITAANAFDPSTRPEVLLSATRSLIISDFFRGRGTNGWEYSVPPLAEFTNRNSNLMTALQNLAQFAGDGAGGAPSFPPVQEENFVHPSPIMSQWGDFSNLRQVLKLMGDGATYDSLSPADKTTLHTAGCLIGMLAHNVDYLEKLNYSTLQAFDDTLTGANAANKLLGRPGISDPSNADYANGLRGTLRLLLRRNDPTVRAANPEFATFSIANPIPRGGLDNIVLNQEASNDPETFVRLMERWRDSLPDSSPKKTQLQNQIYLAQLIITKEQVARDRKVGFGTGDSLYSSDPLGSCTRWRDLVASTSAAGDTNVSPDEARFANSEPLAALCSKRPHYSVLYSIFPASDASNTGSSPPPATVAAGYSGGFLPHGDIAEPNQGSYVRDNTDSADNYIRRFNQGADFSYRVVKPELVATAPAGIPSLAVPAGYRIPGSIVPWKLPTRAATTPTGGTIATGSTPNSSTEERIKICTSIYCSIPTSATDPAPRTGTLLSIPFKDSALFNGREMMSVRALNLNLDLMRQSLAWGGDFWLPKSGLIYAFREDAVSEAHIVRPNSNTWEACRTDSALRTDPTCQMNTGTLSALRSTDPPLSDRRVTPKPVDYYPDPDRRPHGFRLRNGASLVRTDDNGRGMSFVTHNPAYVQGYFNLHRAIGTDSIARNQGIEEFTELLQTNDFRNFYTRTDLNLNFAKKDRDQWRPTEILADAVTPLSNNFCDGSIEDGFAINASTLPSGRSARYGCVNNGNRSSYFNQNRPTTAVTLDSVRTPKKVTWMRSNIADSWYEVLPNTASPVNPAEGESPILMFSGNPRKADGNAYDGAYSAFNNTKPLITADNRGVQMNMIMVSGLVPSRPNQSYGGLHNFPRFLEDWTDNELFMSGAFLQLNFSTYATGPFDQDRWEVSTTADGQTDEYIRYYSPPNRRWGYDVGLQYAAPGPVAERFKFTEAIRSEFYSEPPADDPYITNLRQCATQNNCGA